MTSGSAPDSICSSGWRLPMVVENDFGELANAYNISSNNALELRDYPIYLSRLGRIAGGGYPFTGERGYYWYNTIHSNDSSYEMMFGHGRFLTIDAEGKFTAFSVRCLAR